MDKNTHTNFLLLTPGPVPASSSLLQTLSEPMIHHRSLEFVNILKKVKILLKKMFQTEQEVLILNSSGTGAMAASLLNTLSPGDTVLVLSAGKFGERWVEMATSYKLKVLQLEAPWGEAISPTKVHTTLQNNPHIKAVLAQACETSTGVLHPVQELANLIKNRPDTLFILDTISALGAVDIPMDKWGIDIMIGGSQKSFCLPAGMSFITLSQKAWRFNEKSKLPVYYLDLKKENKAQTQGQTAFSTNVSFIRALYSFLSQLEQKEGLNKLIQKSEALSKMTLQFCKDLGLTVFGHPPSPSVTSIALPKHIDGVKLKKQIEEKHKVIFGGGQEQLKGHIIRVGHLGDLSISDLKRGLKCLAMELHSLDPKFINKKEMETLFAQWNNT